ncbi:MAG: FKBP-type peptidyl-prolyl cis-trans isomerase [Alistipes sp.]|nr:FKBP-type peptidyl-prolyl cis-trans isomerase [Alistipes sp.]
MKFRVLITLVVAVAMTALVGCNDDQTKVEQQRTSIERYLTSSHSPRLIPKEEVANSIEYNPPFYERLAPDVYRYIATYYAADRDLQAEVEMGDVVELKFTAYEFSGSRPSDSNIYYTNDAEVLAEMEAEGLDTKFWSAEPLVVKLGETNIIKGVEQSLLGCREADQVEVYMTYEAAYDKQAVGLVVKGTAVAWYYTISKVTKH